MLRPRDTKKCEKIIKKIIASISETPVDAVAAVLLAFDHSSSFHTGAFIAFLHIFIYSDYYLLVVPTKVFVVYKFDITVCSSNIPRKIIF